MRTLSADTSPGAEKIQIEIIRRMPTWKKLAVVDDLNETVKAFAISGLKQRYPDASPEQIHRKLADLILGEELANKVYGDAR
jgi:hypothetical protein